MNKAAIQKLLKEHPGGIECAVVTGHTVQMQRRMNLVDTLQSAARVRVTGFAANGQPVAGDLSWRTKEAYARRTVTGTLLEETYAHDPIGGKKGDTVYFEPRRVLNTWAERLAEQKADGEMRERWAREKAERRKADTALAQRLAAAQKRLGLVAEDGGTLIDCAVHPDGSVSYSVSKWQREEMAAALEKLVERLG